MALYPEKIYRSMAYYRLSKNDYSTHESDSISNQRKLIQNYAATHADIELVGEAYDDGYTGTNYNRPGFCAVMEAIESGKADCVIVKDLSRLGREYIETGKYLEMVFPDKGVRFIAINDHYDSQHSQAESDGLVIPFKNLINEAYCRDTSVKIRSQLAIKRKRGDFIGSFAVYGYVKDPENKNHLVIDPFAADVVRDIFRWKVEGISAGDIADCLNRDGILAPMDYKKSQGFRFATPFRVNAKSVWNATTILRILKNPVYTGVLEQGKLTTLSYKIKQRIVKPKEEWDVVKGKHEAVITPYDFEIVQKVLARDTRTSPGNTAVELFSGMV